MSRQPNTPRHFGFTDDELAEQPTVFRPDLFAGKTVMVSGAGSGLGRGIAHLFARLGADLVVCGRKAEPLTEVKADLESRYGTETLDIAMTIRDADAVSDLVDRTFEKFGRLDVQINNAGGQFPQPSIDYSVKGWNAVIDTNLNGTWYMMQAAAKKWVETGTAGNIVNIVADFWRGMPQISHTGAARAAVAYLTRSLAVEWAEYGIRVNCVAPGVIETTGFNVYPPEAVSNFRKSNVFKRPGDVQDIAEACVYLAASSGKFVTGETLTVDGGQQLWSDVWPFRKPDYFKEEN